MQSARSWRWSLVSLMILAAPVMARQRPASNSAQPATGAALAAPASEAPAFKPEELEQMLAPIALYPDSLLSQVLMASTYPIEVVEADRWTKGNSTLKGDALAKELEKQSWDPSVKSLVNFPPVLAMMSENLSTTVKIGDAFIGQQKEVMDTVQKLRAKAQATGNLKTTEQQKVSTQASDTGTQVIVVESASPEVIYVPTYSPTVVYGSWPYPAYPPYPYYPPGYVASAAVSFGVGLAVGAAWGYAWGHCNWGGGDVDIDINRNTNINNNIDRSKYKNSQKGVGQNGRGSFQHDPGHRQGAAYRNSSSAQRVGATNSSTRATQARSDYRGRAEAGRSDISRGGADSFKGSASAGSRDISMGERAGGSTRAPDRGGALNDANRSGASTRQASDRGYSSRSNSPSTSSRPSTTRSSPSRSSGGGSRGGGGGRGGGGRR